MKITRGIRTPLRFSMSDSGVSALGEDMGKWAFRTEIERQSPVYQRSHGLLRRILRGLIDNAYEAIADNLGLSGIKPEDFTAELVIEAFHEDNYLIITVLDNGKTVIRKKNSMPAQGTREPGKHPGRAGDGLNHVKKILADLGGEIQQHELKHGTRTEVMIPLDRISPGSLIGEDEYIINAIDRPRTCERTKGFRTNAEIRYLNTLQERAGKTGSSRPGSKKSMPAPQAESGIRDEHGIRTESEWGRKFIDTMLIRTSETGRQTRNIIIGLDTSWIPEGQMPYIQKLVNELGRLSREKGLDSIIITRRKDTRLAGVLRDLARETDTPAADIIILGDHDVIGSRAFDPFREGTDPEKWAFFAGVELPENFPDNNYIRLLEMLTNAADLWAGKPVPLDTEFLRTVREGNRAFRFVIPESEPRDYGRLKKIYTGQLRTMKDA
ncbi:MAG: ATP-binding protein [Candidatus Omnitrophica bacterium]|nr:ATP-binding protein [Candidatus Omnitrophota bacterium]